MIAAKARPTAPTVSSAGVRAFVAGNFALAAAGDASAWQTHAAIGLLGRHAEGLEGLAPFDEPEARFYAAVIRWIHGDAETAATLLRELPGEHAAALHTLIMRPRIRVASQWVRNRSEGFDFLGACTDDHFVVYDVGFFPGDAGNMPVRSIGEFCDSANPPDFFICDRLEWQSIPPDIQAMGCPVFGRTEEYDLLIQSCTPWLRLFDALIVGDGEAWEAVRRISGAPTVTFPRTLGVPSALPPIPSNRRPNDVLLSGLAANPWHTDQAPLVQTILNMPEVSARFADGHMGQRAHHELLAGTKLYVARHRRSGAIPPDALHALSMGCAVLVPRDSLLARFFGESEGVFQYSPADLRATVKRVIESWPQVEPSACRGAEAVRREFASARCVSQYLRFLTVLAAGCPSLQSRKVAPRPVRKRPVLSRGWLRGAPALQQARIQSSEEWNAALQKEVRPETINDLAREVLIEYAAAVDSGNTAGAPAQLLESILTLYRRGVVKFPRCLALRFNLLRALLHFGREADAAEALKLAADTLARPTSQWNLHPMDDVLPYDFFSRFFNYRRYLDLAAATAAKGSSSLVRGVPLILASVHYYIGRHTDGLAHLREAVALDPEFPWYRLTCAQQLAKHGHHAEAGKLLLHLARGSVLYLEAADLLEELRAQQLFDAPEVAGVLDAAVRARRMGLIPEDRFSELL